MDKRKVISDVSLSESKERIKKNIFVNSPFMSPLRKVPVFKRPSLPNSSFKWKVQFKMKNEKSYVSRRRKNVAPRSQPLASSSFLNDSLSVSTVQDPQLSVIGRLDSEPVEPERLIDQLIAQKENELQIGSPKKSSTLAISEPISNGKISPTVDFESESSTDSFFSSLTVDETELITPPVEQQTDCIEKTNIFPATFVRASDLILLNNHRPLAGEPITPNEQKSPLKSVLPPKSPVCSPEHFIQIEDKFFNKSVGDESETINYELIPPRELRSPELISDATAILPSPESLVGDESVLIPQDRSPKRSVGSESEVTPSEHLHQKCELGTPPESFGDESGQVTPSKHRSSQKSVGDESGLATPRKLRARQKSVSDGSELVTPRKLRSHKKSVGDESEQVTPSRHQSRQKSGDESELVTPSRHQLRQNSGDESELVTPSRHRSLQKSGDDCEQVTPSRHQSHKKSVGDESEQVTPSRHQSRQKSGDESELVTPSRHRLRQNSGDESEQVTPRKLRSHPKSVVDESELATPRKLRSHNKSVPDESEPFTPSRHQSLQKSGDDCEQVTPSRHRSHQKSGDESELVTPSRHQLRQNSGDESEQVTPRKLRSHPKSVVDESELATPRKLRVRQKSVSDGSEQVTPSRHRSRQKSVPDESELVTPSKHRSSQKSVGDESELATPSKHQSSHKSVSDEFELVTPRKLRSHQKSVFDESDLVTPSRHRSHQTSGDESELVTPSKLRSHEMSVPDESELVTPRKLRSHQKSVVDQSELATPRKLRACLNSVDQSELATPRKLRARQNSVDQSELTTPRKLRARQNSVDQSELATPRKLRARQNSVDQSELPTPRKLRSHKKSVPDESELVTPSRHQSPKKSVIAHNENQSSFYFSPKTSRISLSRKTYSRKNSVVAEYKSPEISPTNFIEFEPATPEKFNRVTESQSPLDSLPSVPTAIEESEPIHEYSKSEDGQVKTSLRTLENQLSGPVLEDSREKSPGKVVSKNQDDESFQNEEQPSKSIQDETFQSEDIPVVENFSENEFSFYDVVTDVIDQLSVHSVESEIPSVNKGATVNNSAEVSPKNKRNCQQIDEIDSEVHPIVDNTSEFAADEIPSVDQSLENNSDIPLRKKNKKKKKLKNRQQIDEDLPNNKSTESEVSRPFEELDKAVEIKVPSISKTSENGVSPKKKRNQNDEIVPKEVCSSVGETSENDCNMKKKKKKKLRNQRIAEDLTNETTESEVPSVDQYDQKNDLSKKKGLDDVESEFYSVVDRTSENKPSDCSRKKKKRKYQNSFEHQESVNNSEPTKKKQKILESKGNSVVDNPSGEEPSEELPKKKKRRHQKIESEGNIIVDNPLDGHSKEVPKKKKERYKKTEELKESRENSAVDLLGDECSQELVKKKKRKPKKTMEFKEGEENPVIDNLSGAEHSEEVPKKKKPRRNKTKELKESEENSVIDNPLIDEGSEELTKKKKRRHQKTDEPESQEISAVDNPSGDECSEELVKKRKRKPKIAMESKESEGNSVVEHLTGDEHSEEVPKKKKRKHQKTDKRESEEISAVDNPSGDKCSEELVKKKKRQPKITMEDKESEGNSVVDNPTGDEHNEELVGKKKRSHQNTLEHRESEEKSVVDNPSAHEQGEEVPKKKKRKHIKTEDIKDSEENSAVDNPSGCSEELAKKKKPSHRKAIEHRESEEKSVVDNLSAHEQGEELAKKKKRRHRKALKHRESEEKSVVDNPSGDDSTEENPKMKTRHRQHVYNQDFITNSVSTNTNTEKEVTTDSDDNDSDDDFLRSEHWLGREHYPYGKDHYSTAICYGDFEDAEMYPERWLCSRGFQNFDRKILKEIFDFLKLDERLYEKIKNLDIKLDWKVDKNQLLCIKNWKDDVTKSDRENFKIGHFSSEEDSKIMRNWKKFCKRYDFDKNDFAPFLPLLSYHLAPLTKKQKIKFMLFLSQGLNRLAHKCYRRFTHLTKCTKSGKFSAEEDRIIKYLWRKSPLGKEYFYSLCGFFLHRTRDSIYVRCKSSIPDLGGYGIYYDKNVVIHRGEKAEKIKQDLIDKCRKYSPQKLSRKLPSVIEKVSLMNQCSTLQVSKLFHLKIQPMLASKPINRYELWAQIVKTINRLGFSKWSQVDWVEISQEIDNLGPVFLYSEFRKLIRNFVKPRARRLLSEAMKELNDIVHTLKSESCDQELKVLPNKS